VIGNPHPAGPTFTAPPAPGKIRGTVGVVILSIITVFLYTTLWWKPKLFQELHRVRGRGPGGGIGFFVPPVPGFWLLPSTIADAYRELGQQPPIDKHTGWWFFLPVIGWLVWVVRCNRAMTTYWHAKGIV
jgi:hypothetical protein